MSVPALRPATSADLDWVVRVFLACWRGYAAVLPAAVVARMDAAGARELWQPLLAADGVLVAVATADGAERVVGVTRWSRQDDGTGLIGSLYVDPARQGGGHGARLLTAAMERLRAAGVRTATLWVFADNTPALGFYRRQGWQPDGTHRVDDRFGAPEIRMTLDLDAPAPAGRAGSDGPRSASR